MHHIHHLLHTDITSKLHIWRHMFIKGIWASFVAVFIPAILYTTYGLSLAQIFLFIAAHSTISFSLLYLASSRLIARQGTKISMLIGGVCFSIYLLLLGYSEQVSRLIFLAPIFSGLHTAFFWWAYHVSLALQGKTDSSLGKNIALLEMSGIVAAMIGPLVWWLISDTRWSTMLFYASAVFWILSLIPLRLDDHTHTTIAWKPSLKKKFAGNWKTILSFWSLGYIQFVWSIVWSILLFLQFESYTKLGLVSTLTWVWVMIAIRVFWKRSDTHTSGSKKLFAYIITWQVSNRLIMWIVLVSSFFSNVVFMIADMVHKLTYKLSTTMLNKTLYEHTKSESVEDALDNTLYHEMWIHLFRVCMCLLLAGLSTVISTDRALLIIPIFLVILIAPLQYIWVYQPSSRSKK